MNCLIFAKTSYYTAIGREKHRLELQTFAKMCPSGQSGDFPKDDAIRPFFVSPCNRLAAWRECQNELAVSAEFVAHYRFFINPRRCGKISILPAFQFTNHFFGGHIIKTQS